MAEEQNYGIYLTKGKDSKVFRKEDIITKTYEKLLESLGGNTPLLESTLRVYSNIANRMAEEGRFIIGRLGSFYDENNYTVLSEVTPINFDPINLTTSSPYIAGPQVIQLLISPGSINFNKVGLNEETQYFPGEIDSLNKLIDIVFKTDSIYGMHFMDVISGNRFKIALSDYMDPEIAERFPGIDPINMKLRMIEERKILLSITDPFADIKGIILG